MKVQAAGEYDAIDLANAAEQHEWSPVETDDIIEATDVYLDEDIQLNKDNDDWPEFDPVISVGE